MCQNYHRWHILSDPLFLWCLWMMPLRWLYSEFLWWAIAHISLEVWTDRKSTAMHVRNSTALLNSWPYLETDVVGYHHPVLHVVSHALIFRCGELLSCIKAVPFYGILFLNLLTYLPTPWRGVLLEKLTGSRLIKKFPTFYGTQRFVTIFTSATHPIPHILLPEDPS